MNKKTIFSMFIIILILLSFSGCSSNNTKSANQNKKNTQVMEALDETVTSTKEKKAANTANEDLIEMRHWKYAVSGPATMQSDMQASEDPVDISSSNNNSGSATSEQLSASYEKEVVTIQLITEDEMDAIINKLISLGYLGSILVSEAEFKDALKEFQVDNGLSVSGVLDSPTLLMLKTE